jgi:hypothetical protein
MSFVNALMSKWWVPRLVAGGLLTVVGIYTAEAQVQRVVPGARAPHEKRGILHSYHRSLENAKRSNVPAAKPGDLPRIGDTYKLWITKRRFLSRQAGDVISGINGPVPQTFELLCYNGQAVGPIIRVKRAEKFKIHVKNDVHGSVDPGVDPADTKTAENDHGLCTTNLHTHGLHVSPSGKSDNIFRQIEPGKDFTFEYKIGDTHPAGTFWYHPHKHGSTAYQLSNGLSGALIVEGTESNDLDQNPQILATRKNEQVVVLQSYTFGTYVDLLHNKIVGFIDASGI